MGFRHSWQEIFFVCLAIGADPVAADFLLRDGVVADPLPELLIVCHGNGCRDLGFLTLTPEQWNTVRAVFFPFARDAAEERDRLRTAIALMERSAGTATGTWRDKGGSFNGGEGQMDCLDETTNTTQYLRLLERFGLMRLHRVDTPATRGWFIGGWPHTTAAIAEVAPARSHDGTRQWAVDSWFLENGEPPFILPLDVWKAGWAPGQRYADSGKMPGTARERITHEDDLPGF